MSKSIFSTYPVPQKQVSHFYLHNNFSKNAPFFIFFTVMLRKDLRGKLELKLNTSLKFVDLRPLPIFDSQSYGHNHIQKYLEN